MKKSESPLYFANGLVMMVTFFFARFVHLSCRFFCFVCWGKMKGNVRPFQSSMTPPIQLLFYCNSRRLVTGFLVLAHMGWSWISLFEKHWPRLKALDRGLLVGLSSLAAVHLAVNLFWFGRILKHLARSRHKITEQLGTAGIARNSIAVPLAPVLRRRKE